MQRNCTLTALCLAAAIAAAVTHRMAAQDQQPPAFKSSIDLVPVDVSVVDNNGRPVSGLEAGDFALTVDGKPRRIASAEFISAGQDLPVAPGPAATHYSTNTTTGAGRLIMIVVDQGNIGNGRGRQLMESASKFVMRLGPSDRVGLVAIPGTGPQVDFTANHALVAMMLQRLAGLAVPPQTQYRIGLSEAYRMQDGDAQTLNDVVSRECVNASTSADLESCRSGMLSDAVSIYNTGRARSQNSILSMRYLMDRLALTSAPKTLVFVSEGLFIERDFSELSWLAPTAARGQVTIYAMHLNEPYSDVSTPNVSPTRREDLALGEEGLGLLAGLTRGTVMRIAASGDYAFNRLALEISAYYLLSFEPEPGDRDGKTHKIKVALPKRSGVELRARSEFSVGAAAPKTEDSVLTDLIKAPLLAKDIGISLSTYTLRDPSSDKLRILVAAEIDRALNPEGKLSVAYALVDEKGHVAGSRLDRDITAPVQPETKRQTYTSIVLSDSTGPMTLKLAAVDDRGRRGSVEHTFRGALTSVGQIRATDLLLTESQQADESKVQPVVARDFTSGIMHGYLELYCDAVEVLNNATVMLEIAQSEDGRALDGAAVKLQPPSPEAPKRRIAEGSISLGLLPPGDYVARAIISIDGRRAGQVTRPLRVGRMVPAKRTTSAVNLRPVSAKPAPIPFTSRIEKFERASVLTPQVVGFFLDRMNFGAGGAPNAAPAIAQAREGHFEEAMKMLGTSTSALPVTFLNGLALYAKGDLEPAAAKFRETLRLDSEFFPAAFYLGSCYAAGGRDSEAVGAWQMSLVTESDAPFIYTLLGDALLRLRETDHALEILNEAAAEWPDNEEVQVRLGSALAMAGKRAEAIAKLEPYLEKHPDDVERHFVALRTLYEARTAGKPVRSQAEDRALFARWAAAYSAAKGPQQAIVDQWQKAINR